MTELALDTELNAEQREYLETVKMSSDSLLTVINDILDFSKIEAGKTDLEMMYFNLCECLEATLKTFALRSEEKGLELLCEFEAGVPEIVEGDAGRLRQILTNLVGNAIKFTDQGEVTVTVGPEDGEDGVLRFTVADTGVGIPEEKLKLIFDPFSQADSSTTRKYGGTGLGLTISARLAGMMGGRIWVESEVGRGTKFHFAARLKRASGLVSSEPSSSTEIPRGARVLVVDDNETSRRILEAMLRAWELDVKSVESGICAGGDGQEHAGYGRICVDFANASDANAGGDAGFVAEFSGAAAGRRAMQGIGRRRIAGETDSESGAARGGSGRVGWGEGKKRDWRKRAGAGAGISRVEGWTANPAGGRQPGEPAAGEADAGKTRARCGRCGERARGAAGVGEIELRPGVDGCADAGDGRDGGDDADSSEREIERGAAAGGCADGAHDEGR